MVKLIVMSMLISISMLVTSIAYSKDNKDTYVSLECTGKGDKKKCKTVRKEKISDSITYLDMSVVEGDEDNKPSISDKGKL